MEDATGALLLAAMFDPARSQKYVQTRVFDTLALEGEAKTERLSGPSSVRIRRSIDDAPRRFRRRCARQPDVLGFSRVADDEDVGVVIPAQPCRCGDFLHQVPGVRLRMGRGLLRGSSGAGRQRWFRASSRSEPVAGTLDMSEHYQNSR